MRWRPLAAVLSLALVGCASRPPIAPTRLAPAEQRTVLQSLTAFSFHGRAAIAGETPSVQWRQENDASRLKLLTPLGTRLLQVEYSPERLRLVSARGIKQGDEADQALLSALGFVPPFAPLRYWILGVPEPGSASAMETYDAHGLLQQLQQHDWMISYQRYVEVSTAGGVLQLPALLVATRGDLQLKLVIDEWRIK